MPAPVESQPGVPQPAQDPQAQTEQSNEQKDQQQQQSNQPPTSSPNQNESGSGQQSSPPQNSDNQESQAPPQKAKESKSKKFRFQVVSGVHQDASGTYGKGEPDGDTVETDVNLQEKFDDHLGEKFRNLDDPAAMAKRAAEKETADAEAKVKQLKAEIAELEERKRALS